MQVRLSASAEHPDYTALNIHDLVELLARPEPAPAAGTVVGLSIALAGALCVKSARLSSRHTPTALELQQRAERLVIRAKELAQSDAEGYVQVIAARRHQRGQPATPSLAPGMASALRAASKTPFELAKIAVATGAIAAQLAEIGNPNLIGDSLTAAHLADAAVRSAAALIAINLASLLSVTQALTLADLTKQSQENIQRAQRAHTTRLSL